MGVGFISFWIINLALIISLTNFLNDYQLGITSLTLIILLSIYGLVNARFIKIKKLSIPSSKIKFGYRENDLDKDLIFLSASFRGEFKEKQKIEKFMKTLKEKKNETQPTKIKTGGSTFKNPISQTNQKVWELIKKSVPIDTKFGDAEISDKHCNFFVNRNNASFDDMQKLINFVKEKVKLKTGIKLETEVEIIN